MIFTRNRQDWLDLYKRRRVALFNCANTRNCNAELLKNAAILLLEAHHCGPWRMLWALFKYEVLLSLAWYMRRLGIWKSSSSEIPVESEWVRKERRFAEFADELAASGDHRASAVICCVGQIHLLNDKERMQQLSEVAFDLSAQACAVHRRNKQEEEAIAEMMREL